MFMISFEMILKVFLIHIVIHTTSILRLVLVVVVKCLKRGEVIVYRFPSHFQNFVNIDFIKFKISYMTYSTSH